jgi:uncharacterized protein
MTDTATATKHKIAWVDLATSDAEAARAFYADVLGWRTEVNPDPQYGGYGLAKINGEDVAGIGPTQSPDQPTAWSVYVGADDLEAVSARVTAAGGTVVAPAFDVGDQGRMAVFQDPSGAFISAWQATRMSGFQTQATNAYGWADLNARGVERAIPFYTTVFGWTPKSAGTGERPYTEFQVDGQSIAGATEMDPAMPAGVPSHWMVYFNVEDVDAAHATALVGGGREVVPPLDFPGGRMSIVSDPQGASFGLLRLTPA